MYTIQNFQICIYKYHKYIKKILSHNSIVSFKNSFSSKSVPFPLKLAPRKISIKRSSALFPAIVSLKMVSFANMLLLAAFGSSFFGSGLLGGSLMFRICRSFSFRSLHSLSFFANSSLQRRKFVEKRMMPEFNSNWTFRSSWTP